MLKFTDDNDFLLVDKYKQNDDGSVNWSLTDGDHFHTGVLFEGMTRDIEVEDGTESIKTGTKQVEVGTQDIKIGERPALDENGDPLLDENGDQVFEDIMEAEAIYETQDVYEEQTKYKTETVDIWGKFQSLIEDGVLQVEGKTQEELILEQVSDFKQSRENLIAASIVTTESGNKYDGDNDSIQKMANKILSYSYAGKSDTDTLEWSLAGTGTGVMTEVTFKELKEAHHLSVEYVQSVWGIE